MNCISPIVLKNGCVVPCGKCELCLSKRRNDWSVRVQLHCASYERMPLFVTVTYDPEHVPYGADDNFSLCRRDLTNFIKRYRDRNNLYNTDFSFFGCGEYGGKGGENPLDRPHYHLIIFGDDELYNLYDKSVELAEKRIRDSWQNGVVVHVCVAEWSGIHYVTKYVLKESNDDWSGDVKNKPFTCASHGIGLRWLETPAAIELKKQLQWLQYNKDWLISQIDVPFMDNPYDTLQMLKDVRENVRQYYPDFRVLLPSGQYAYLPREIKRRLLGSFEHFKDSPLWLWNHLNTLIDSLTYYLDNGTYDSVNELPVSFQQAYGRIEKIKQRLILNKHKKLSK